MKKLFRSPAQLLMLMALALLCHGVSQPVRLDAIEGDAVSWEEKPVELPIIMYHSVVTDASKQGDYIVTAETFRRDMQYMKSLGYESVTLQQLLDYVNGQDSLPPKPIMVTLDDGCFNNYQNVLPILQQEEIHALVSPVASLSENADQDGVENELWSYLSAKRMQEMSMSGFVEFGNHTYDMHRLKGRKGVLKKRGENVESYRRILQEDIDRSQNYFLQNGLAAPRVYVYPYGAYGSEAQQLVRQNGFVCSMTCAEKINHIVRDPECLFDLGRYNRPAGKTSAQFFRFLER